MTQPKDILHIGWGWYRKPEPLDNPKRNLFDCLRLGEEFYYGDELFVKITYAYYNIANQMVNAISLDGKKMIYVYGGYCARIKE